METFQGHICCEGYLSWKLSNLHFNSSVLWALRIGFFSRRPGQVPVLKKLKRNILLSAAPKSIQFQI